MTGFGRGVAEQAGLRATVDVRAVNHRFLDLKLRGAAIAPAVEEAVATKVRAAIERGAVSVPINTARPAAGGAAGPTIDPAAAQVAYAQLTALSNRLGLPGPDLALVLAQPGVVSMAERPDDEPPVLPALEAALVQLDQMRTVEGQALAAELTARFTDLTNLRG